MGYCRLPLFGGRNPICLDIRRVGLAANPERTVWRRPVALGTEGGEREALGGELQVSIGWDIDEWQLTSTAYRVEKP